MQGEENAHFLIQDGTPVIHSSWLPHRVCQERGKNVALPLRAAAGAMPRILRRNGARLMNHPGYTTLAKGRLVTHTDTYMHIYI